MQCGYEEDAVLVLQLVVQLALAQGRDAEAPSGPLFPFQPTRRGGGTWLLCGAGGAERLPGNQVPCT